MRNIEAGVEFGAGSALDAVVWPEALSTVGGFDRVDEWLLVVGAGEGDVATGMPVLGEDNVVEMRGEGVDTGYDRIAISDRECAAGEEVDLHVDDEQRVGWAEIHSSKRTISCKDRLTSEGAGRGEDH